MPDLQTYDVLVIGGGKAGKTLATDLGHRGVKTALIERDAAMIGGSCINVACIPTKSFIESARLVQAARNAAAYGIRVDGVTVDWNAVRKRVEGVVTAMREMNHRTLTSAPALDFIIGTARFVGAHEVEVRERNGNVRRLIAERIFINTGTRPAWPAIRGLGETSALTSETIQRLESVPRHLVILGGGYVALEFAQMFRRFGSEVTIIERGRQLLKREDADIAAAVADILRGEGIALELEATVEQVGDGAVGPGVKLRTPAGERSVEGTHLLVALGRSPNVESLNLDAAGIETDARHFIKVNDRLETSVPGVWALGDVNGGPEFTHVSLDDYRVVAANVFGGEKRSTRGRLIPFTVFIEPELARIGLTEKEAREQRLDIRIAQVPVSVVPRAKTSGHAAGMMKAVVETGTDRILGCALLGENAGEVIGTVQMAMACEQPFTTLRDAILVHPTMGEGLNNLFAAL